MLPTQVLTPYFRLTSILRRFRLTARQFMSESADKARQSCCFTDSETRATCGHPWLPSWHVTTGSSFQTCAAWGFPHIPPLVMTRKPKQPNSYAVLCLKKKKIKSYSVICVKNTHTGKNRNIIDKT